MIVLAATDVSDERVDLELELEGSFQEDHAFQQHLTKHIGE